MAQIHTLSGDFNIRIMRIATNLKLKVLLLHGGTGATPEYLEAFNKNMENPQ